MKKEEIKIIIDNDFCLDRKTGELKSEFLQKFAIDLRTGISNPALTKFFNDYIFLAMEKLANAKDEDMLYQKAKLKASTEILAILQSASRKIPTIKNEFIHQREAPKKKKKEKYEL